MVSGPSQKWALVLFNLGGQEPSLLWHQRRILGEVAHTDGTSHSHLYVVLTPDGDVYIEDYSGRDRGVTAVRFSATRRALPPGVPGGQTYRVTDDIPPPSLPQQRQPVKKQPKNGGDNMVAQLPGRSLVARGSRENIRQSGRTGTSGCE